MRVVLFDSVASDRPLHSPFYLISTEIDPQRWKWWKNRSVFSRSQSATRTMKFHYWKNIVRGVWLDERCFSLVKGDRTASHVILGAKTASHPFILKMSGRFVDVDNFSAEQENKTTLQKTQRNVKLSQTF